MPCTRTSPGTEASHEAGVAAPPAIDMQRPTSQSVSMQSVFVPPPGSDWDTERSESLGHCPPEAAVLVTRYTESVPPQAVLVNPPPPTQSPAATGATAGALAVVEVEVAVVDEGAAAEDSVGSGAAAGVRAPDVLGAERVLGTRDTLGFAVGAVVGGAVEVAAAFTLVV